MLTVLLRHQLRILGPAQPHAHIADGQAVVLRILSRRRARPASPPHPAVPEAVTQQVAVVGLQEVGQHGRS